MRARNINFERLHLFPLTCELKDKSERIIIEKTNGKSSDYKSSRRLGCMKGEIKVMEDFDTWPDDIAISLGMKD